MKPKHLSPLSEEFVDTELGDARLNARLKQIAGRLAAAPADGFPKQTNSLAELEAFYRFFENDNVSPEAVFGAHVGCTIKRAEEHESVLIVHDTTKYSFGGEKHREGLGWLQKNEKNQGFFSHTSIALSMEGKPLGALAMYNWARAWGPNGKSKGKRSQKASQYDPDRESLRWNEAALHTGELLSGKTRPIHVEDREGDSIENLALLLEHEQNFVIRLSHDRLLAPNRVPQEYKLFDALSCAPIFLERDVVLSERKKTRGKTKGKTTGLPPRKRRRALLEVRAESRRIFPGRGSVSHLPPAMTLNFVEVREANPPEGEEPVLWRLITTEPIGTEEQVAKVIDIYRKRWTIEEFFKAVKTGCKYQERQLATSQALLIDLAIECAVAWRMLLLRWLSRNDPDAPASHAFSPSQLIALRALSKSKKRNLPKNLTVIEAYYEVAAFGGHIKNNGAPGWLVLRRGFDSLYTSEQTVIALMEQLQDGDLLLSDFP